MQSTLQRSVHALMLIGLLALGVPADAQWKWRDAKGRVQYSDLPPPPDIPAKDVLQSPIRTQAPVLVPASPAGSAASAPGTAASTVDPALEAKRKQAEQEEAAKRKSQETQQAQARAQNCERAQGYLRTLESGRRISRTNAKGEQEFLDDAARNREFEQTRQIVASECR